VFAAGGGVGSVSLASQFPRPRMRDMTSARLALAQTSGKETRMYANSVVVQTRKTFVLPVIQCMYNVSPLNHHVLNQISHKTR
jgi:hypothetical protein